MTYTFDQSALSALAKTASTAAGYLDACDAGALHTRLDPAHYKNCGMLLFHIFSMLDGKDTFPTLIEQSLAARDIYDSIKISSLLEFSRLIYYPQMSD